MVTKYTNLKRLGVLLIFLMSLEKNIMRYKPIGYNLNVMRQSACLVGLGVRLHDGNDLKLFILVGWDRNFRLLLGPPGLN